jgi:recombination protein RecA
MTDINEILASLNPKVREKVVKAREVRNEKLALPSIGLTAALGGGIGYGRQTMIWGNRSAGKTLLALGAVAEAQANGKLVAWVDAEKNFDPDWATEFGVVTEDLMVSRISAISDMADVGVEFIRRGADLIVVDSISALLPNSYFDDGEIKAFDNTQQIGTFSKNMGAATNMLNAINNNAAIVYISQVRNEFGSMHASLKPMGGKGVDHMNSTSIKVWSSMAEKEQILGPVSKGDARYEVPIGRPVKWFIDKNRGPGMGQQGQYDLYHSGDFLGIDQVGEVLDIGLLYGKVKKGGAWYTIYGEQCQGKPKAVKYLRENPEVFEKLVGEVLG